MWHAIAYVSSGFTLAAFVAAVAAWIVKGESEKKRNLIGAAKDEERARLVQDALEFFRVDTARLTKDQKFALAREQIQARADRFRTLAMLVGFLTMTAAALSAFAISQMAKPGPVSPPAGPTVLASKPNPEPTSDELRNSFVTSLTVVSEFDADVFVDGVQKMRIDHRTGSDRASAKVRVLPRSMLTLKMAHLEKSAELGSLCEFGAKESQVRVSSMAPSDIQLTEDEVRAAMGDSSDVPRLLKDLREAVAYQPRAWAAERLGYIGGGEAIDGLADALRDPEPYVQAVAAYALGRIGDPRVLPQVEAAFATYREKSGFGYMFEAAIRNLRAASLRTKR